MTTRRFRRGRLALAGLVGLLSLGLVATPSAVAASADDSGSAEESAVRAEKLANARVDPAQTLHFGAEPLAAIEDVAADAAAEATCTISAEQATALALAPTWPETSGDGTSPSPMTLARYDTQPTLADPAGREGLWFHPGIGVWQMDSAGFGANNTAAEAMDVGYIATIVVPAMVTTYCNNINSGVSEAQSRRNAWQPWVACWQGACEDTYNRALAGVTPDDSVEMLGGAELRDCVFRGEEVPCVFVDPARAQGNAWWAAPGAGRSPITAPFYSIRLEQDGTSYEVRHWLDSDSGAGADVTATRPFGGNARDALTWEDESVLCDLTEDRGTCVTL